jgi:amidase
MRFSAGFHPETQAVFEKALAVLRVAGATLVDIDAFPNKVEIGRIEHDVLMWELKADLNAYLATTDARQVPSRSLADLIAFNRANAAREMPLFAQELFETAQATTDLTDPAYLKAEADARKAAGPDGIDAMLKANSVDVLVAPTLGPSWLIDPVLKDRPSSGGAGGPAAVAGYPHLTVPMGQVDGLPVGLSFIGTAWSEPALLAYGYAFEQRADARHPPAYLATAPVPGTGQ